MTKNSLGFRENGEYYFHLCDGERLSNIDFDMDESTIIRMSPTWLLRYDVGNPPEHFVNSLFLCGKESRIRPKYCRLRAGKYFC